MPNNNEQTERICVGIFKTPGGTTIIETFDNADALIGFSNEALLRGWEIYWQGCPQIYSKGEDAIKDCDWEK